MVWLIVCNPPSHPITHSKNSTPHNPSPTDLPVPVGGGVALAYPLPTHVLHHALGRPVRLAGWPDSGGYPTGCRGDSATLRSPGNAPLAWTDGLVARTRWGTPPGHVLGVRFETREPAAVIQTVVHCMLQNRFAGFRIRRVAGKHIG